MSEEVHDVRWNVRMKERIGKLRARQRLLEDRLRCGQLRSGRPCTEKEMQESERELGMLNRQILGEERELREKAWS